MENRLENRLESRMSEVDPWGMKDLDRVPISRINKSPLCNKFKLPRRHSIQPSSYMFRNENTSAQAIANTPFNAAVVGTVIPQCQTAIDTKKTSPTQPSKLEELQH
jgi:hypothetical protein